MLRKNLKRLRYALAQASGFIDALFGECSSYTLEQGRPSVALKALAYWIKAFDEYSPPFGSSGPGFVISSAQWLPRR
jgi:hypothetical protein